MDQLFSPWRMEYISRDKSMEACAFCDALSKPDGPENLILSRGATVFVILNLYPYTSGHLMVVPYLHRDTIEAIPPATQAEMMALVTRAVSVLKAVYHPQGFNIGVNLGAAAGAGIAEHLHMHVVPRWNGDSNFVSVIGKTRNLPETLADTYARLAEAWQKIQ